MVSISMVDVFNRLGEINRIGFFKRAWRFIILLFKSSEMRALFNRIKLIEEELKNEKGGN